MFIVNSIGQKDVWFTVDPGIHGPVMEVKFTLGDEWNKVHLRMGVSIGRPFGWTQLEII